MNSFEPAKVDPFNCPEQLDKDAALALHNSDAWKGWSPWAIATFQMEQDLLCVPFKEFHKAMEECLGRPVYTHEFAFRDHLRDELNGKKPQSTFDEVINLLPQEKVVMVELPEGDR